MSVKLSPFGPKPAFFDNNGDPLSGGKLYFYIGGTTTPQNTYTDSTGSSANANPVVLNSRGEPANEIWFTEGQTYKAVLKTSADVTIWTVDNITAINDTSAVDEWKASGVTPTFVSATSFTLSGDQTTEFHVGRRLKSTNTAGTIYSTLNTSSHSAGTTTVTVVNDSGSLDSGLSAVSYSLMSSASGLTYGNTFRKNALINGGFDVWQRGTSFSAVVNDTYQADCFQYSKTGAMVHTISRSTDVPTVAQCGRLLNYSILIDCTTVDAAIAAGDFCVLQYPLEGYNWLPIAQRITTLSFWVKATKTGIYCVSMQNTGNDRAYIAEFTVSVTDTWERKTVTFPASPSAGTWDYTNGRGVKVRWCLAVGSTWQTTPGSWQTGHFIGTANQVNACDDTANNFRLAMVQLEQGSVATDFEYRTYNNELALCQRYYQTWGGTATQEIFCVGTMGSTSVGALCLPLKCEMRAAPTLSVSAVGDFELTAGINTSEATVMALAANGIGISTVQINVTGTGAPYTAGQACILRADTTTSARLNLAADL